MLFRVSRSGAATTHFEMFHIETAFCAVALLLSSNCARGRRFISIFSAAINHVNCPFLHVTLNPPLFSPDSLRAAASLDNNLCSGLTLRTVCRRLGISGGGENRPKLAELRFFPAWVHSRCGRDERIAVSPIRTRERER